MNWNNWIRQTHRWLSLAFTVIALINMVALARGSTATWVGLLALPPLLVLLFTGLYLFVLPYTVRRRGAVPPR